LVDDQLSGFANPKDGTIALGLGLSPSPTPPYSPSRQFRKIAENINQPPAKMSKLL